MPKVSEDTIKRIRELGMAKALVEAQGPNASAEFKEGVRRFYPNAKAGPKTKAAAEKTAPSSDPDKSNALATLKAHKGVNVEAAARMLTRKQGSSVSNSIKKDTRATSITAPSKNRRGVNQSKPIFSGFGGGKDAKERRKKVEAARRAAAKK